MTEVKRLTEEMKTEGVILESDKSAKDLELFKSIKKTKDFTDFQKNDKKV